MKKISVLLLFASMAFMKMPTKPFATIYYFSTSGSDANTGLSPASPWQTISKFNSFAFQPGDSIVFNRGNAWTGTAMVINRSGSSGAPIKIGAYGSGADPVISGMYSVLSWTHTTGDLYTATIPAALSTCRVLTFDGAFQPISKYPRANNQYININNGTPGKGQTIAPGGTGTITSTGVTTNNNISLSTVPGGEANIVGMEIVPRPMHWVFWNSLVTGINTGTHTITFQPFASTSGGDAYSPIYFNTGYGFFFQNHPNLCTQTGDWAYNGNTHTLTVNFGAGGPTGHTVKVSAIDNLVTAASRSFVNISDIYFEGANTNVINLSSSTNFNLNGVTVFGGGVHGVFGNGSSSNFSSTNCFYLWNNSMAMRAAAQATNWTLTGNYFDHTGSVAGMGGIGEGQYFTVRDVRNSTVRLNTFKNNGYCAISFQSTNNLIENNFIDTFCTVKDDGSGIYTGGQNTTGSVIAGNIVIHGQGIRQGTPDPDLRSPAIYVDDGGNNVEIKNNFCAYNGDMGINVHNGHELNIHDNICFDNLVSAIRYYNDGNTIANITLKKNIFVAKTTSESLCRSSGGTQGPATFFAVADSNRWCRTSNDNGAFQTLVPSHSDNLATWKTFINKEAHSQGAPVTVTDPNDWRVEYNATNASVGISLGGNTYIGVKDGAAYSGTLTLPAWTGIVLIKTAGGNALPSVFAGPDIPVTLPTSMATMAGNATDADGTITQYTWSKISGPATFTITDIHNKNTTITDLVQGTYVFQLNATDNSSGVGSDLMQVIVSPAPNTPPSANAGGDIVITLPTVTVTLNGSGNDPEGATLSYLWTKQSGPASGVIVSSSQAQTAVNGLSQGVYQFDLRVTDNGGLIAHDVVQVTVNAPANQSPVVTFSATPSTTTGSTTTLTGTATDPDGTIDSTRITFVSGPGPVPVIANPTSLSSGVTGMTTPGSYTFQFKAYDHAGASTTTTVVVLVTVANQSPVAHAGTDISITLPVDSATLNGSTSTDDVRIAAFNWTQIGTTPSSASIISAGQAITKVKNLGVSGTYKFQLRVTDNNGVNAFDTVQVVVSAPANPPPIVSIPGGNQTITKPTNSTTVTGSASDPGGSIDHVLWTVVGKPTGAANPTFTAASSNSTGVNLLDSVGAYTLRYTATDNLGATKSIDVVIQVNAAPNVSPTANAGADQVDTLGQQIFIDGSASTDPDGNINSYRWLQLSGPVPSTLVSVSQRRTEIRDVTAGIFQFQLRVTDNKGAIAFDTVQVRVYDSIDADPNIPPVANAGPNYRITLCGFCGNTGSLTVTGGGTNGSLPITTYEWIKISGPSQYNITNPDSASTTITGLIKGTYVFQLTVTDGRGLADTDTIIINVIKNYLLFGRRIIIQNY